jgi:hypothetical protein
MPRKNPTQVITDLCQAINAVDGTFTTARYIKQQERVRKTLLRYLHLELEEQFYNNGTTLGELTRAIRRAGWEGQKVVRPRPTKILKIVEG